MEAQVAQRIEQALRGLEHGSVQLVVHDSQIVRIERVERLRLTVPAEAIKSQVRQPTDSPEVCREESGGEDG